MKRLILTVLTGLLLCFSVSAIDSDDLYASTSVNGLAAITDTAHVVCADLDLGASMNVGVFLGYSYGVYGSIKYAHRLAAKQYDRFAEVPSYLQLSLGGGGFIRFDNFFISADVGLLMANVNKSWECGAELTVKPFYVFVDNDVMHYSLGFPVSVAYTGNTSRLSVGVAISMEIYK